MNDQPTTIVSNVTPKPFKYYNELLKEHGYPFAWYLQREPRKLIIGPKGYTDNKDFFEIGLVCYGVSGYSTDNKGNRFAMRCEGISYAAKLGLKFLFCDVENAIPPFAPDKQE